MVINHNMNSIDSHRQMMSNIDSAGKSMAKLSSGLRINKAGDDAAGLSISEKMRAQIRGLNQASRNAQDAISLVQTAEGGLNETHKILQRMRELAVQSSNDTNVTIDRQSVNQEMTQLQSEITRIGDTTQFNTRNLLTGSASGLSFQIGANNGQTVSLSILDMRASSGLTTLTATNICVSTATSAKSAITNIQSAIDKVSTERAKLGALQNRLEHTIANLDNASENLQAAESRIRDVDMASEMMEFSKSNILSQASQAMLAQANQQPQGVLQLLR